MNLLLYGFVALAVLGLIGTGVYKVKEWGADEVRLEWAEANKERREAEAKKISAAAKALEVDRGKAKIVYRTITREVDRIVTRDVYRNVCLDADGLRIARCAIRGESTDRCQPDKPVP